MTRLRRVEADANYLMLVVGEGLVEDLFGLVGRRQRRVAVAPSWKSKFDGTHAIDARPARLVFTQGGAGNS